MAFAKKDFKKTALHFAGQAPPCGSLIRPWQFKRQRLGQRRPNVKRDGQEGEDLAFAHRVSTSANQAEVVQCSVAPPPTTDQNNPRRSV